MKIINFLFLFYSFFAFSQGEKLTDSISVVTSFNGRHCDGKHGLCDITISEEGKKESGNASLYNNNGKLKLVIHRNKLSNTEEYKVMGKRISKFVQEKESIYTIDYDFELDSNISNRLKLKNKTYTILRGRYPLIITNDAFIITFKLE
ncbi:hypothetical protein [uncultured Lacinutrix sp.]|uniref:hypothetical protein n=1 Tax=uncultured Lacinutrix sp. TaxID=574032 RepID=UPI002616DA65|nr:hypothetical protein [uncultured Lacinutrix sp.]